MKGLIVFGALLLAVAVSGCVIEATPCSCDTTLACESGCACDLDCGVHYCWETGSCVVGASCDYVGDMDCVSSAEAWWCSPSGLIQSVRCDLANYAGGGCFGVSAYTLCGYIPGCQPDDRCICLGTPYTCGSTVTTSTGCTGVITC